MDVSIISHTPEPEKLMSEIASICHDVVPNESILKTIIRLKHYSVLEHATVTFKITGVSRTLTHQLVRHRIGSYTQESQRYVSYDKGDFIVPESLYSDALKQDFNYMCNNAVEAYKRFLDYGVPKEDARFILPQSVSTKIIATYNYRSLLNFYAERICGKSQWEIRKLAGIMRELIRPIAPTIYMSMVPRCVLYNLKCNNKSCNVVKL